MKIAIASDHGGYALKKEVEAHLTETGVIFDDLGCHSTESCDYPAFAKAVDSIPETYNALCDRLDGLEDIGRVFVQAPERPIEVSRVEGDPEKLGALYWQGYTEGLNNLPALSKYLGIPL